MASIRKRGERWLVTWREGGRGSKQLYKSFTDEADALRFKRFIELPPEERAFDERQQRYIALAQDPSQWPDDLNEWMKPKASKPYVPTLYTYAKQLSSARGLKSGSRRGYLNSLKHLGKFGETPITDLTSQALRTWWESLDIGHGAEANVWKLLGKVEKQAANDGVLPPGLRARSGIKPPSKRRRKKIEPLTPTEVTTILEACKLPVDRTAIMLATYGGLRSGEVGGLRARDFHPETCRVHIEQATYRNGGDYGISTTKSEGSDRKVRLPRQACAELKRYIAETAQLPDGRIFYTSRGFQVDHIYLTRKLKQAAERAGVTKQVSAHTLRHTAVALLIAQKVHPKSIQAFCGHKQLATTMDQYGHLFDQADDEIGTAMEQVWEEAAAR